MSKPAKKVKADFNQTQLPSKAWAARQFRRKLYEDLQSKGGRSTGSVELDEQLRREFGGLRDDPTQGNFRTKIGDIIEGDEEDEQPIELFNGVRSLDRPSS
jgi:hypothetical protein